MNIAVFKPYKTSIDAWSIIDSKSKQDKNGRTEWCVEIGTQQIVDNETQRILDSSPLEEYIYKDILQNAFSNPHEYNISVNLGYNPPIVITYDNRLVIHNDQIQEMVTTVIDAIKDYKIEDIAPLLISSLLNLQNEDKLSKDYKDFLDKINDKCNDFLPPLFVGQIAREYFFEQERNLQGKTDEIHYMTHKELLEQTGEAIKKNDKEILRMIKDEMFYSMLMGDIIQNPVKN